MQQSEFQSLLDKQIGKGNIFNIVMRLQSQDRGIDLAGASGMADAQTPMTVDTPYVIASITKMYTATVIFKLFELGLVDMDAVITKYLPESMTAGIHVYKGQDYSDQIKVYQLVNQTSGLADYYEDRPDGGTSIVDQLKRGKDLSLSRQQMVDIVRGLTPKFEPGAKNGRKAHYSDINYQLLGEIIESVTQKPVAEAYREYIFEPLDLHRTRLFDASEGAKLATIYYKDRAFHVPRFLASSTTDGGLVSTALETMTFLRAFFAAKLFDSSLLNRYMGPWNGIFFPIQYGYGMMRFKLPRIMSPFSAPPELIGHSGSTGSFAFYNPQKALYVTGSINQVASPGKPFQLMTQVINSVK